MTAAREFAAIQMEAHVNRAKSQLAWFTVACLRDGGDLTPELVAQMRIYATELDTVWDVFTATAEDDS